MHCKHTYTTGRSWYIQGSCFCNLVYSGIHIVYSGIPWYTGFIPWYAPYALVYNSIHLYTMLGNCIFQYTLVLACVPMYSLIFTLGTLVFTGIQFCIPVCTCMHLLYPCIPWYKVCVPRLYPAKHLVYLGVPFYTHYVPPKYPGIQLMFPSVIWYTPCVSSYTVVYPWYISSWCGMC